MKRRLRWMGTMAVTSTIAAAGACGGEAAGNGDATTSASGGGSVSSSVGGAGGAGGSVGGAGTGTATGAPTTGVGGGGGGGVTPNPDAHYIVFEADPGAVYGVDLTSPNPTSELLGVDEALALMADGQTLLARVGDQAVAVDFTTSPPTTSPFGSWTMAYASIAPDGLHVYAHAKLPSDLNYSRYMLDASGNAVAELDEGLLTHKRWAPDSSALASFSGGGVHVNVIGETTVHAVVYPDGDVEDLIWSPTSDRFVYVIENDGLDDYRVMLATLRGNTFAIEELLSSDGFYDDDDPPSWAPDGQRLVFEDTTTGVNAIRIADLSGSQPMLSLIPESSTYRGALYASDGVLYAPSLFERRWFSPGYPLGPPAVTASSTESYIGQYFSGDAHWLCQHEGGSWAVLFDMSAFPTSVDWVGGGVSPCRFAKSSDYLFASNNDALIDLRSGTPVAHDLGVIDGPSYAVQTGADVHVLVVDDNGDVHHRRFDGQAVGPTTTVIDVSPGTDPSWTVLTSSASF